jgi:acetylornithine aminotransferase/acetylornithine/N-succinyldiaminopimelate aminotransferase
MFGLQLSIPARPLVDAALARGLLINAPQEGVLRVLPAYIVGEREMNDTVRILDEVFDSAASDSEGTCEAPTFTIAIG